jgi:hypothetical protein
MDTLCAPTPCHIGVVRHLISINRFLTIVVPEAIDAFDQDQLRQRELWIF